MNSDDIDLIERYCRGELNPTEHRSIEERMAQEPELNQEVLLHQDVLEGMNHHFSAALKSKLQQAELSSDGKKPTNRFLMYWLAAAATISLFFGLGYWLIPQSSPESLYQAYYQPYPNIVSPSERSGNQAEDEMSRAMRAYEQQDYPSAIALFQAKQDELGSAYQFYLAICYLETSEYKKSIAILEEVRQSGDQAYALPTLWYQCMAYLADDKPEEAKGILQKLAQEEDGFYSKKARELLDEM